MREQGGRPEGLSPNEANGFPLPPSYHIARAEVRTVKSPRTVFVLALLVSASAAVPVGQRVDEVFAQWDKKNFPGCAIAVIQEGRILYERGYGMAHLDHDIALSPKSIFHVASVSKQFAAAAIVLLAQRGKLSLEDPLPKHTPELPEFRKPITINPLLPHLNR